MNWTKHPQLAGYARAFAECRDGLISPATLRDYEIMRVNQMAAERGARPAERLRRVLALENAERVRNEYPVGVVRTPA